MTFKTLGESSARKVDFFYISTERLLVLSNLTLGLYHIYWFYKNFEAIRKSQESGFSSSSGVLASLLKAIFSIFFCYGLFKKIYENARDAGVEVASSTPSNLALLYIALYLAAFPYFIIFFSITIYIAGESGLPSLFFGFISICVIGVSVGSLLPVIPVAQAHSLVVKCVQKSEPTRQFVRTISFVEIVMVLLAILVILVWVFILLIALAA
jgi:hypothetical protein